MRHLTQDLGALAGRGLGAPGHRVSEDPASREDLVEILAKAGISIRDLLRRRGTSYDELGLDDPKWSDDQLIDFVGEHPILMERPVVVAGDKARLCRPVEELGVLITQSR